MADINVIEADPVAYCPACNKFVCVDENKATTLERGKQHVRETEHEVIIGTMYCPEES